MTVQFTLFYVDLQNVGAKVPPTHKVSLEAFICRVLQVNMILESIE
jgi:hypothetical protein